MIQVTEIRIRHHDLGVMESRPVKIIFCDRYCMEAFRKELDTEYHELLGVEENDDSYFKMLNVELDHKVK